MVQSSVASEAGESPRKETEPLGRSADSSLPSSGTVALVGEPDGAAVAAGSESPETGNSAPVPTEPVEVDAEAATASPADGDLPLEVIHVDHPPDSGAVARHCELLAAIQRLQGTAEAIGERSRSDQEIIERMQGRIEALQTDQVRALLGPVVTELAGLQAQFIEAAGRDYESLGLARVRKEFALLGDNIDNALDLLGAVSVGAKAGQAFDSRLHTAARQIPTGDPALDKTIAAVLRHGFTFQNALKPALYARVSVYKYDVTLATPTSPAEPAQTPIPESDTGRPAVASPADHSLQTAAEPHLRIPFQSNDE